MDSMLRGSLYSTSDQFLSRRPFNWMQAILKHFNLDMGQHPLFDITVGWDIV
jgi:hypothetical protein